MMDMTPVQAGPSSCGTTSIAHFFSDAHGLRVAKNYVEGANPESEVPDGKSNGVKGWEPWEIVGT